MRLRWLCASLAGLAFLAVLIAGARELWPQPRYNVIVLTVESAQAGVISPEITPNIWRLLDQGMRFDNHRAVSAWTATNIISLLTGVSPFLHLSLIHI